MITDSEATGKGERLKKLRDFSKHAIWEELSAKIAEMEAKALSGLSALNQTAEERSEWIQAYHMAKELREYVPGQIQALHRELTNWTQEQREVSIQVLDSLG